MVKGDPFYYHKPGELGKTLLTENRRRFRELREWLKGLPQTRELAVALTKLQEASMWSNAAIALTDPDAEVIE
jgi:hypothetical protein